MKRRQGRLLIMGGIFLLAILAGVVVFTVTRRAVPLSGETPTPQPEGPRIRVVVAARDIPRHTVIQETDVSVDEVQAELVPDEAMLGGVEGVLGRIAQRTITKGETLVADMLATYIPGSGEEVAFTTLGDQSQMVLAGEGQVLMAILLLELGRTQFLAVGNHVDLLVSLPQTDEGVEPGGLMPPRGIVPPAEGITSAESLMGLIRDQESQSVEGKEASPAQPDLITFYTIQNAEIAAIRYASGEVSKSGGFQLLPSGGDRDQEEVSVSIPQALLVALDPQDALILKHLLDRGDTMIDIVLRAPTNDQLFDTQSVDRDYLYDRYKLSR